MVLICSSLISDAKHPFMDRLATGMSSLGKKHLVSSSAHFKIRVLGVFFVELYEFFIDFGTPDLIRGLQIFSPIL